MNTAKFAAAMLAVVAGCGNATNGADHGGGSFECEGIVRLMEDGGIEFPSRDSLVDAYSNPSDIVGYVTADGIVQVIISRADGTSKARIELLETSTGWESGRIERC
jgi:hypothetical protein